MRDGQPEDHQKKEKKERERFIKEFVSLKYYFELFLVLKKKIGYIYIYIEI